MIGIKVGRHMRACKNHLVLDERRMNERKSGQTCIIVDFPRREKD
jgi:hypothetical protein